MTERMTERIVVHKNRYQDSARLMRLSKELAAVAGIEDAQVLMGTDMNRELLQEAGFADGALREATPLDLVVALRGASAEALDAAAAELDQLLQAQPAGGQGAAGPREAASLQDALSSHPDINLVSVAVPGAYAAYVAQQALDAGRHVFLFSDNVALEDEVRLKSQAAEAGLLLMGPDCGTAIIAGTGLGFANRVRRGAVGLVGASGTGIQEISSRVHQLGGGISHAIGTGSRDLKAEVDGRMTRLGVDLLAQNPDTRVIGVVAKTPDAPVAESLHRRLAALEKPVVVRYLGQDAGQTRDGVRYAASLEEASRAAMAHLAELSDAAPRADADATPPAGAGPAPPADADADAAPDDLPAEIERHRRALLGQRDRVPGRLVGLFGGGSLASEAALALRAAGLAVEIPAAALPTAGALPGEAHLVVDVGDDHYTVGKPHPMVDQTTRCALIRSAGADPGVGLLLLDLVLGDGAHPDPAPEIREAVEAARRARGSSPLLVVASVTGTDRDPQGLARQRELLASAGISVQPSATHAAQLAAALLRGADEGRSA